MHFCADELQALLLTVPYASWAWLQLRGVTRMNLPTDRVHHISRGYCHLVLPLGAGRWLAIATTGFCVLRAAHFHNTRAYGR